jgi:hypothetical protein
MVLFWNSPARSMPFTHLSPFPPIIRKLLPLHETKSIREKRRSLLIGSQGLISIERDRDDESQHNRRSAFFRPMIPSLPSLLRHLSRNPHTFPGKPDHPQQGSPFSSRKREIGASRSCRVISLLLILLFGMTAGCTSTHESVVPSVSASDPPPLLRPPDNSPGLTAGLVSEVYDLKSNTIDIYYDASKSPITIKLAVTPQYVTRKKYVFRSEASTQGYYITQTFVDPNAVLHLEVRDMDTDQLIAETGFGETYSQDLVKELKVFRLGCFHIVITGQRLKVDFDIVPSVQ